MRRMGAVAKDVEGTSETVHSHPVRAEPAERAEARARRRRRRRRRERAWPIPFEGPEQIDLDAIEPVSAEEDTDFTDEELTIPDPLPDIIPAWAPLDIGQALIDEWDATAEARAARPALVARVLRSAGEDTAITSIEKPAIRSAS